MGQILEKKAVEHIESNEEEPQYNCERNRYKPHFDNNAWVRYLHSGICEWCGRRKATGTTFCTNLGLYRTCNMCLKGKKIAEQDAVSKAEPECAKEVKSQDEKWILKKWMPNGKESLGRCQICGMNEATIQGSHRECRFCWDFN